jgi:hypothetical protein
VRDVRFLTATPPNADIRAKGRDNAPTKSYYEWTLLSEDHPMFARLRRFLGNVLGSLLYWIGWALAVVVLAQAIILSVAYGSPLIPVLLGVVGVIVWVIAIGLKYILAGR